MTSKKSFPTEYDIFELSKSNPIIDYALNLFQRGQIDWEVALMLALGELHRENERLTNILKTGIEKSLSPSLTINLKGLSPQEKKRLLDSLNIVDETLELGGI